VLSLSGEWVSLAARGAPERNKNPMDAQRFLPQAACSMYLLDDARFELTINIGRPEREGRDRPHLSARST